jgi:hypothetical protein
MPRPQMARNRLFYKDIVDRTYGRIEAADSDL